MTFTEQARQLGLRYRVHWTDTREGCSIDQRIYAFFDHHSGIILLFFGLLLIGLTCLIDYWTGPELSFGIFYLLPIAAGAWWGGFSYGVLFSLISAVAWHGVDLIENPTTSLLVFLWNGIVRFGFFVITSSLLSRLRASMIYQETLARTDSLTGAANGRTFYEIAYLELQRSARTSRPLTLVYIDLDNFKGVNDRLGHSVGDEVLRRMAATIQKNTRMIDLLARLGGDEFALLLPETAGAGAEASLAKLAHLLSGAMADKNWPVTFSIGAATFLKPPRDVDVMLRQVDALMYAVKRSGKNSVRHQIVDGCECKSAYDLPIMERRSTVRVLCNLVSRVSTESSADDLFATIRNISATGVGLYMECEIPVPTCLTIEPVCNPRAKTLLARVVRSMPDSHGWFHGCELSNHLNPEELQDWLA